MSCWMPVVSSVVRVVIDLAVRQQRLDVDRLEAGLVRGVENVRVLGRGDAVVRPVDRVVAAAPPQLLIEAGVPVGGVAVRLLAALNRLPRERRRRLRAEERRDIRAVERASGRDRVVEGLRRQALRGERDVALERAGHRFVGGQIDLGAAFGGPGLRRRLRRLLVQLGHRLRDERLHVVRGRLGADDCAPAGALSASSRAVVTVSVEVLLTKSLQRCRASSGSLHPRRVFVSVLVALALPFALFFLPPPLFVQTRADRVGLDALFWIQEQANLINHHRARGALVGPQLLDLARSAARPSPRRRCCPSSIWDNASSSFSISCQRSRCFGMNSSKI